MKYEAIEQYSQEYSVGETHEVLSLAKRVYYQRKRYKAIQAQKAGIEKLLAKLMSAIF